MSQSHIFGSIKPIRYIVKVTMGQCNTQPEDGNNNNNEEMFRQFSNDKWKAVYTNLPSPEKNVETRDVGSNSQRRLDSGQERQDYSDTPMNEHNQYSKEDSRTKNRMYEQNTPSRQSHPTKNSPRPINNSFMRDTSQDQKSPFRLSTSTSHSTEAAQSSLPDGAVRTRCYRLNLDIQGLVSPTNCYNGPFEYDPACYLHSKNAGMKQNCPYDENGSDILTTLSTETSDESDKQVAIKTAQIFRDLAITDDGNIISTNPRANRGSSKSKVKPGEKSRQAAKIDKAKDLIDDVGNVEKMDNGEKSTMISLFVLGEYDDMKCLVIEGASTLKDNSVPDEALLRNNVPRRNRSNSTAALVPTSSLSSNIEHLPSNSRSTTPMRRSGSIPRMPQSCPPKIKGHPRDLSRTRKPGGEFMDLNTSSNSKQTCNDLLETFLNCGTTGKHRSTDSRNAENSARGRDYTNGRLSGREEIHF